VLTECPSPLGVVLWLSVRDVRLWAEAGPDDRPHLFADGASALRLRFIADVAGESDLASYLSTIAAMLGVPESVTGSGVATACSDAAGWAAAHALPRTALAFSQAAALADPGDPTAALQAGLSAAAAGELLRAETWLRRAIGLARRARQGVVYARASAALSRVLRDAGLGADAERQAHKGLRAARRAGCTEARGESLYVLFQLAREEGRHEEADRLAALAIRALGRLRHRLLPDLLDDVARSLLDRREAVRALAVLASVPPMPRDHARVAATLALRCRAFALTGDRARFVRCWARAWKFVRHLSDAELPVVVLDDLTTAAVQAGDRRRRDRVARLRRGKVGA
jgi:tetratricopeptide (TPR) repeat protein